MKNRIIITLAIAQMSILLSCGPEVVICPNDDPTLHTGRTPTSLQDDCRCVVSSNVNYLPGCLTSERVLERFGNKGEGPSPMRMGHNARIRYGELWEDRNEIITAVSMGSNQPGFILGLDLATGNRRVISGWYTDPKEGPKEVGDGPEWGKPSFALRGPDDKIYVYTYGHRSDDDEFDKGNSSYRIWRVDPDTGSRELVWRDADKGFGQCSNGVTINTLGKPVEPGTLQLQPEAEAFELTSDGSFLIGTLNSGWPKPGYGIIEISPDGKDCRVVTMTPGDNKNEYKDGVGSGFNFLFGARSINEIDGKLYVMDTKSMFEVDRVTGKRTRLWDEELPPGLLELDKKRNVFHVTATQPPFATYYYVINSDTGKSFKSGGCLQPDPAHPYAEMCAGTASGNAWSGGPNNHGWLLPDGEHMIHVNDQGGFLKLDIDTGVSNHFSY